jgi:Zn-dependent M28 family amino/carboxypeptidase
VNGHFDSPLGSPGAADCGSCVASMLELSRLIIDSGWVPPRPVIFLFNGAEELFLLGSHGFIKTHPWNSSIGAFINIEASGSGGTDLVCQSGPGSWPSRVYAQTAKYPMANSVAQDMFGIIPGDTDYRIFAEDITNIPGLDIIFVLGGYFYHTSYDTLENLFPGSIQARGENLFNLVKAFTNSMSLKENETSNKAAKDGIEDSRAVFFDYLTWFMVS